MFSYYGGKSKVIHLYPQPKHDLIIEPFAGSARYACKYGLDRDVWINDLYEPVYRIWKWLIGCSINDILSLPELKKGDDLRDYKQLSDVERYFLGFCVGRGRNSPENILTGWAARDNEIQRTKNRIKPIIGNISHWRVTSLDFRQIKTMKPVATYFIDAPYQNRKSDYIIPFDDYSGLRQYAKSRKGQVIVCEGFGADWLDFRFLHEFRGQRRQSIEVMWTNTKKKG